MKFTFGFYLLVLIFILKSAFACESFECLNGGICDFVNPRICVCGEYFTGETCEIQRKSQKEAFLFSLVFGLFAGDRFYLEQYSIAIPKLIIGILTILFFISICFGCGLTLVALLSSRNNQDRFFKLLILIYWILFILTTLTCVLFWIIDFSTIANYVNNIDGRGIQIVKDL